ncbi:hypothetical protein BRADI_2g44095v3 [Brachypodium distachyon]|uniref:Uncharacterized protein n=1 Tax=Brachypodium distachyon TaxID=15368 RepID=A0A0Q3GEA5_BRADI|nr:hypothetical protein BRADI_2g44095v3 [Brachypodium distachyon]
MAWRLDKPFKSLMLVRACAIRPSICNCMKGIVFTRKRLPISCSLFFSPSRFLRSRSTPYPLLRPTSPDASTLAASGRAFPAVSHPPLATLPSPYPLRRHQSRRVPTTEAPAGMTDPSAVRFPRVGLLQAPDRQARSGGLLLPRSPAQAAASEKSAYDLHMRLLPGRCIFGLWAFSPTTKLEQHRTLTTPTQTLESRRETGSEFWWNRLLRTHP